VRQHRRGDPGDTPITPSGYDNDPRTDRASSRKPSDDDHNPLAAAGSGAGPCQPAGVQRHAETPLRQQNGFRDGGGQAAGEIVRAFLTDDPSSEAMRAWCLRSAGT
jgi:hypothetical protein